MSFQSGTTRRAVVVLLVACLLLAVGSMLTKGPGIDEKRLEVERLVRRGNYREAERVAAELLKRDPAADDIRLIAAQCAATDNEPLKAIGYLDGITSPDTDIRLDCALLQARLMHERLYNLTAAETAYRTAVSIAPQNAEALNGLVRLLAVSGRRREALPYLLELVRLGASSDVLIIAARASGAINDSELLQNVGRAFPNDARYLLGLALDAFQSGQPTEAAALCLKAAAADSSLTAAHVARGWYLLEAGLYDELELWRDNLPEAALEFAETWQVLGQLHEQQGKRQSALHAFLMAARLGPDLKAVHHRLSLLFRMAGDEQAAAAFSNHLQQIQQLETQQDRLFSTGSADVQVLIETVRQFVAAGRMWEALGWTQLGLGFHQQSRELQDLLAELSQQTADLPLQLVVDDHIPAMRYAAEDYAIDEPQTLKSDHAASNHVSCDSISFDDEASRAGLKFRYHNGVVGPTTHRMFEFTGGGIGVIDFDLDDFPDVFCTQGGLWESRGTSDDATDSLFRNRTGQSFVNVSELAGIHDQSFGQGVAVGDVNGDGFPDVFVANIGPNTLWINAGDGTFTQQPLPPDLMNFQKQTETTGASTTLNSMPSGDQWTTSVLIADVNNDGAVDLFAVNYLQGGDVFERVCSRNGIPQACIPVHFDASRDQLLINDAEGGFKDESGQLDDLMPGKGLGVLAWSPRNDGQIAVFVANDTTPNMLLEFPQDPNRPVRDLALQVGVALNGQGKAEGCMGIAAADLNQDGFADLFVTNFYNESNTLYLSSGGMQYDDRTRQKNLERVSMPVLGFGTQFLDADLDTYPELIVANGHVDDLRAAGKPYQMPAHYYCFTKEQFQQVPSAQLGAYFQQEHLGRAVVVLDWNRDLRPDLLIGHLEEDYALLTNKCSNPGGAVTLRLVGVTSARDAVGTTVRYQLEGRTIVTQLTAGDGYHCSNQRQIMLACGSAKEIRDLTIQWPSGEQLVIATVVAGSRFAVVEHCEECILLPD